MAAKKSEDHSKAGSESKKTEGSGKASGQGKVKDAAHDGRLKENK